MSGTPPFLRSCIADAAAALAFMDWRIHRKDTTASTNLDARFGLHGDVYLADFQTAGRGRLDHRWIAPAGVNLTFSAVMDVSGRPPDEIATSFLSYLYSL